jgi:ankyrin repeat protein
MAEKLDKKQLGEWLLNSLKQRDEESALKAIRRGADLTLATAEGLSALCLAIYKHQTKAALELIARGANVNYQNFTQCVGLTPLMRACFDGQDKVVDMLLTAKADANLKDADGRTALHCASHFDGLCDRSQMVPKLLKVKGIDVNAATKEGFTVLMANFGQPENIKLLLEAGADMEAKDNEGRTAYDQVKGTLLNGRAAKVYEGIYDNFNRIAREKHEDMVNEAVSIMMEGSRVPIQGMRRIKLKGGFWAYA